MPRSVNGCGTAYYGAFDRQPDGSFVTTKWFILCMLPLIPLGSVRVRHSGASRKWTQTSDMYEVLARAPLDMKMVWRAYAWMLIPLALLVASFAVLVPGSSLSSAKLAAKVCGGMLLVGLLFWVEIFPALYKAK